VGPVALVAAASLATMAIPAALIADRYGRWLLRAAMLGVWLAVVSVVAALIRTDTSYELVVDHTRPGLGVFKRIMGLWGGSAGSLLLFVAIVGTVLAVAPTQRRTAVAGPLIVAPLAWASALISSPFERLDVPAIAGSGLSPILEHWAMLIHPPLLYLGLALALVPAIAFPTKTPGWTRAALIVLTTALVLGAGWAYVELGWGGWWAWDPVENAALIPWLLLVVQVHLRQDHVIARSTSLLIWPAVIGGAAMTRTSLRTSVHAFADATSLQWILWPLTVAVTIGAIVLYFTEEHVSIATTRARVLAATVLTFSALVVALGTFRPFIPGDATDGTFYARSLFPVAVLGPIALGVVPRWGRSTAERLAMETFAGALIGVGLALLAGWTEWFQVLLAAGVTTGLVTIVAAGIRPLPRVLAHVGMTLILAGALGGTASVTRSLNVARGDSFEIGGHTITNLGSELTDGAHNPVLLARVRVDDDTILTPLLTFYPERNLRLPEVATRSRPWEDIQVLIRSADDDGGAILTVNQQPLTQVVWYGAALIVVGAGLSWIRRPR
jgi:cytochrome c-type biogenesis protein CcmF